MIATSEIEKIIKDRMPGVEVYVNDTTGTMDHFQMIIVSPTFVGLSMVQQHQAVYAALKEEMKEAIHALSIKTLTPEQWQQQKPKSISM